MTARPVLLACLVLTLLGCGCRPPIPTPLPEPPPPHPSSQAAADQAIVCANNGFALKLFEKLRAEKPDANLFISPLSVSIALSMTANGAVGDTRTAMDEALGFEGPSPEQINQGMQALKAGLMAADLKVELAIADSLWASKEFEFKPEFLAVNREFYDAEVATLDFSNPGSARTINRWVDKQTRGLIPDIIDAETLQKLTMVLLDAVYFKGKWTEPFEKSDTQEQPFTLLQGEKTVPLMSQSGEYSYLESDGFQAIRLPYGDERLEMLVVLPVKESSLAEFCQSLTLLKWDERLAKMAAREGTIKLPRFTAAYDGMLNDALTALGMGAAFDDAKADFSAMATTPMCVSLVRQKSYLKVDEEGTEAAAVTEVGMGATAAAPPPGEPFEMIVDRPFFLAIRDSQTNTILFMGAIVDPQVD